MLIVYATAIFVAVRHEFLEQFDGQLHDDFETAEGLLTWMPDGRVALDLAIVISTPTTTR